MDIQEICCVCLDRLPSRILACEHKFCRECVVKCLTIMPEPVCPLCRKGITDTFPIGEDDGENIDIVELLETNMEYVSRQDAILSRFETRMQIRRTNAQFRKRLISLILLVIIFLFLNINAWQYQYYRQYQYYQLYQTYQQYQYQQYRHDRCLQENCDIN